MPPPAHAVQAPGAATSCTAETQGFGRYHVGSLPNESKADGSLFVGRKGDLYVILTTCARIYTRDADSSRSGDLRTYAYDTALPGGKWEEGDKDEEWTAVSRSSLPTDLALTCSAARLSKRYLPLY